MTGPDVVAPGRAVVVAIDGPSGSGKSTVARRVAERLGYLYLDTGAMYRAVGVLAAEAGVSLDDEAAVVGLARRPRLRFDDDGTPARRDARRERGDPHAATRERSPRGSRRCPRCDGFWSHEQRAMARERGVVMEGRDIGTNVFPDAPVKIFLTASPEVRAERRLPRTAGRRRRRHAERGARQRRRRATGATPRARRRAAAPGGRRGRRRHHGDDSRRGRRRGREIVAAARAGARRA